MAWVLKMDEVIESGLAHDFDASLSGIGQELGAGAYSMRWVSRRKGPEGSFCPGFFALLMGRRRARSSYFPFGGSLTFLLC